MIHRLYNPCYITNDGERAADRLFVLPQGFEHDLFHIIYQLRISSRFLTMKMAGECDFVVFTRFGVMVMEVKGGLIGYGHSDDGGHDFYRLVKEKSREAIQNPFTQADANAAGIKKFFREKGLLNIFVGTMVCFPECVFDGEGIDFQDLWHRGEKTGLMEFLVNSLQEQIEDFNKKQALKNVSLPIHWRTLEEHDIRAITDLLKPEFEPRLFHTQALLNLDESARRSQEALHILSGLNENRRIMVQGPPGSGKTTYALSLISRLCLGEGAKGLYLCWNDLLAATIREKIHHSDPGIPEESIHVVPLFYFVEELAAMTGDPSLNPTFEKVEKGEMRQLVSDCLSRLFRAKALPKYDFIIADEAQDLFAKGLDLIIKSLLRDNNPLQKGNYHIFYDDRQAYPGSAGFDQYIRTRDTLREASAHYTLFSNLRINTGHGLAGLIQDAGMGQANADTEYGKDVKFIVWKSPEEAAKLLRQFIDQEIVLGHYCPSGMMVLFAADLAKKGSPVRTFLAESPDFELMTSENLGQDTGKIRYTTILKSKGLEWDVVFLVFSSLEDAKSQYQLFIGASRGKGRVYVMYFSPPDTPARSANCAPPGSAER